MLAKYEEIIVKVAATLMGLLMLATPFSTKLISACPVAGGLVGKVFVFVVGLIVTACVVRAWEKVKDGCDNIKKSIVVKTEEGDSLIAIGAIEGLLRDELCREKDIYDVNVSLNVEEEGSDISCNLHFKLDTQPNIPARVDVHKRTVKEAFEKLIPGQKELNVRCTVDKIVVSDKTEKNSGYGIGDADFSGPVYPVPKAGENGEDGDF